MVKRKPWQPLTLEQVGGTSGVGVNFLEETFSSVHSDPRFRRHAVAARGVLRALLPELGTDIKGHMRTQADLLDASGYADRPSDFADLLRILDGELRLMTPTDPDGASLTGERQGVSPPSQQQFYQLTHDYLLPSLREWLTRKQRETRSGRAELKLEERAALWNAKPENRYLPSLSEWLSISTLTESKHWTAPQRAMMKRVGGFHLFRSTTAIVLLGLAAVAGLWTWSRVDQNRRELVAEKAKEQEATRIEGLVGRLKSADPAQVPNSARELEGNQTVAATYLSPLVSAEAKTIDEKRSQLHALLATVGHDKSLIKPLLEEYLTNKVAYIGPIREQLRPISGRLLPHVEKLFGDAQSTDAQRLSAANAFADYAASDIPKLSQLLMVATPPQYVVLYPIVAAGRTAQTTGRLVPE